MGVILITGGAGFIGSHIAEGFLAKGHTVKIIDNFSTGSLNNIKHIEDKVDLIKGDIRDKEAMMDACKGVDFISHQAGMRSVPLSVEKPHEFNDVNILGHLTVLESALASGVKKVVFASSSSVYGNSIVFPQTEDHLPQPVSPYAITKRAGEYYNKYFYEQFGLQTLSMRYFNVFGPRQDPSSQYSAVIPIFIRHALQGTQPLIHWDGHQSKDFTYVANNVGANVLAYESTNELKGDVINISAGQTVSVNIILQKVSFFTGVRLVPRYEKKRQGDVRKSVGNPSLAKQLIGYETTVPFEEGLKQTVEWYKSHPEALQ